MASKYYGTRKLSDEQRKEKSELAKSMHQEIVIDPETGLERRKFGGPQPRSGRPRKPRASEIIAEKVAAEGTAYFSRLDDIAKNHPSANSAIAAIKELLEVEEKERKVAQEEERKLERLHRDELILLAIDLIEKTGIIGSAEIIDGELEGEEDGGYPELGQGSSGA
jgi:hypothetical protein